VRAEEPVVKAINASETLGAPSIIVVTPQGTPGSRLKSSSPLIQNTLLPALLSGAAVKIILQENSNNVIHRVEPFALGHVTKVVFDGDYYVSRIATQRKKDGTDEHLEVFLKKIGDKSETAYNVYNPLLQQLLIAAFSGSHGPVPLRVDVKFDGKNIVTATLGEKDHTGSK
jgi:hypothetical protein